METRDLFVPYPITKVFNELGFTESVYFGNYYEHGASKTRRISLFTDSNTDNISRRKTVTFMCKAPLWQQVINWLGEKYDIHIVPTINPYSSSIEAIYGFKIYMADEFKSLRCIINHEDLMLTKEEAREQSSLIAIELCKNQKQKQENMQN